MATITVSGIVRATNDANGATVAGFTVHASCTRLVKIDPARDDTIPVTDGGGAVVGGDGAFSLDLAGDGAISGPVVVTVSSPDGHLLHREEFSVEEVQRPLTLRVEGAAPVTIEPSNTTAVRILLTGRVVDEDGKTVPAGLPVVIWGVAPPQGGNPSPAQPLVVTKTQASGYFSGDWVSSTLESAYARVAGSGPLPIPLEDERLPRRVLLVLDLPDEVGVAADAPPRVPDPVDLTRNPAAFSQDLGRGCVDLCTPNRVIEEFTYNMVVRTSEPDVKGLTLGVRRKVPPALLGQLVQASVIHEVLRTGTLRDSKVDDLQDLAVDVETARALAADDSPPSIAEIKRAAFLSYAGSVKDLVSSAIFAQPMREPLDGDHPIDWDDTPTVYQSVTLARGHILEFREVWRADGYSLGDVLYSLPLAPGQRRQVAIVDWERRTTTTHEEALEYEEQLDAFVSRDRDISEIVGSRLAEESAAASRNTTWGVSGGIGAGFIGTGFGIFGGVAGSSGGSSSSAWQDSSRQFAGDSLQSLRDRVMQRASAVRDERSTVVETAAQGETMRAESETIGNYNHCHAMTVEYFEVLRHFVITHELADVRECLFVPLPMAEFTAAKALRWQTPLFGRLKDRSLLAGFSAMRRIADNWVGWDYPVSRYSEEAPQVLEGELRVSFILPRPRDKDDGAFQVDMWDGYRAWLWMDPYELWTQYLQEQISDFNADEIAKRDRNFRQKVAPEIAKRVMDRLRFWYVAADGGEIEVPLDATLVSRYAEGVPLYATLRPAGGLPPIPREQIVQFKVSLDSAPLPPDAQIIVHSCKVRYQTEHKRWLLFSDDRILNDLSNTDPVYVRTPLSFAETRNPRQEDRDLQARLLAHLNEAIEYYHQVIWTWLDAERRFMLLDGILVPGMAGKSVASLVENRLIGIAGNSLILPVAPGIRIDPRVNSEGEGELMDLYAVDSPPPVRVSVPTRGVYAEAVIGSCNACEEVDDSRYWRWTSAGMLAPPQIQPVSTDTRASAETALETAALPKPLVSIQNAPELPAPVGLGEVFKLLARPDLFTDITGLEGTQKNARAGFDAAMSAVSGIAAKASEMAKQEMASRDGERMLDRINRAQQDGLLTPGAAQDLSTKVFGAMVGSPDEKADKKAASPVADPEVQKAIDKASQNEKGSVKVSTNDESIELTFDGGDTRLGGASGGPALLERELWIDTFVKEDVARTAPDAYSMTSTTFDRLAALEAAFPLHVPVIKGRFLRAQAADPKKFEIVSRLRIVYPADPANDKKVAGQDRLPLAVLVHGNHESWEAGDVRNHDGYSYLQEYLAKAGIISVSVDQNAANFFDSLVETRGQLTVRAIDFLRGEDKNAASPLYQRIDFDRVGLMGHSRGGDAVVRAAKLNAGNKYCVIRAVALVAPTDFTGRLPAAQRNSLSEAEAGFVFVMYGGLDGDVSGVGGAYAFPGTGFRHYDRTSAPAAMLYLPGCIHNRFNRTWVNPESGVLQADLQGPKARVHPRGDHEQLMNQYVGGLFEWKLGGVGTRAALFNGMAANMFGHDASLQWLWGAQSKRIETFEAAAGQTGTRTVSGAEVKAFAEVKVGVNKLETHTSHETQILAIDESLAAPVSPALDVELAAPHRDWSGFETLTFRLGTYIDVSSEATIAGGKSPPPLAVTLIDGAGKSGTVSEVAFTTPDVPGKPVFHEIKWSGATLNVSLHRLATVAITLTGFNVDLHDVRRIQIVPQAGFAQRVFVDTLALVKP